MKEYQDPVTWRTIERGFISMELEYSFRKKTKK